MKKYKKLYNAEMRFQFVDITRLKLRRSWGSLAEDKVLKCCRLCFTFKCNSRQSGFIDSLMWVCGIKSMNVNILGCVRVSGIDSSVRQGYAMTHWVFNVYLDGVRREKKLRIKKWKKNFHRMGKNGDYLVCFMQITCYYERIRTGCEWW